MTTVGSLKREYHAAGLDEGPGEQCRSQIADTPVLLNDLLGSACCVSSMGTMILEPDYMRLCTLLLERGELPSPTRWPPLVVNVGDEVAGSRSRYRRSRVRCWKVSRAGRRRDGREAQDVLVSRETAADGAGAKETQLLLPREPESRSSDRKGAMVTDTIAESRMVCGRRDLIVRVLLPRKRTEA